MYLLCAEQHIMGSNNAYFFNPYKDIFTIFKLRSIAHQMPALVHSLVFEFFKKVFLMLLLMLLLLFC
jgi:hypothetical protein